MVNLYKVFNIAGQALSANQLAISTAGHNIANVNTDGYSRQKVALAATTPETSSEGVLGTGVAVSSVRRVNDGFLNVRLTNELESLGGVEQKAQILQQMEVIFQEGETAGLNNAINKFFGSWGFLAGNSEVTSARTDLISKAENMSDFFNKMDTDLKNLRSDTNTRVKDLVTEINLKTSEIAKLNTQIHEIESGNVDANDLRDNRDFLVGELGKMIHISYFENSTNMVNIVTDNGFNLVESSTDFSLSLTTNASDPSVTNLLWTDQSGNSSIITSNISGGEMAALIELRDTTLPSYNLELGKLASGVINEVNKLHSSGFGLDGSTGINFFSDMSVTVTPGNSNAGSTAVSSTIVDQSSVRRDEFEITIASATTFTLTNTTLGSTVGIYSFSSGTQVLTDQGLAVTLSGAVTVADTFAISVNKLAASNMSVSSTVKNNINKVAASTTDERGDGTNAQAVADLEGSFNMGATTTSGTFSFTFGDFYSSLVSSVGSDTRGAAENLVQQEGVVNQIENLKESVSGVNIDEEMIAIIKFQRAFEAAAKLINVVDSMLVQIMESVR